MSKDFLKINLNGGHRELLLFGALAVTAIAALWYFSQRSETPSVVSSIAAPRSQPGKETTAMAGLNSISRLQIETLRTRKIGGGSGNGNGETNLRRNPFIYPKPKPAPTDTTQSVVPVKPRPTAEYLGYLTGDNRRIAIIKINNESQVIKEGARLLAGYTVVSIDPKQIVLKDSDGESYPFMLPK